MWKRRLYKTLPLLLCGVSCVVSAVCLVELNQVNEQMTRLGYQISNTGYQIEEEIQSISGEVERQLERQANLLADSTWSYDTASISSGVATVRCFVTPKEYRPDITKAVLVCNGTEYPMHLEQETYTTTISIPLFEESHVSVVQFEEEGLLRTERLNWSFMPRYDCLSVMYINFRGRAHARSGEGTYIREYDGTLHINYTKKGGESSIQSIFLVEYLDGVEQSRIEIPCEPAEPDHMEEDSRQQFYTLKQTYEIPFGSTHDLYAEVVDEYGLHHRTQIGRKIIDKEGKLVENDDWDWQGSEAIVCDEAGNVLFQ